MCEKIQRAVKQSAKMGLPQVSPYLLFFAGEAVSRGGCEHTFVLSQEIASCEKKSLRQDAQLADKKQVASAACSRAEQKLCCQSSGSRGMRSTLLFIQLNVLLDIFLLQM